MAQLSKYPMDKELEERMFDVFYEVLADVRTKGQVRELLTDLLSPTEQTMLAKRLAIALLLIKGESYRYIRDVLKVSTSTILMIQMWLDGGGTGYRRAIKKLIQKEKFEDFFDRMEEIIERVTIPRPGTNWSLIRSRTWKDRVARKRKRTL